MRLRCRKRETQNISYCDTRDVANRRSGDDVIGSLVALRVAHPFSPPDFWLLCNQGMDDGWVGDVTTDKIVYGDFDRRRPGKQRYVPQRDGKILYVTSARINIPLPVHPRAYTTRDFSF